MKRRSTAQPKRDREMDQVRNLTTVKMTKADHRIRLLADKAAIESKLKDLFKQRRFILPETDDSYMDAITLASKQLREIKTQLDAIQS